MLTPIVLDSGTLTQTGSTNIILTGGLLASQVFFAVAGAVSIGASANSQGIIIGKTSVAFLTGSSLTGRVYAQTAVTLQQTTIALP